MGFGILLFFALPDAPSKAWFFNAEEKKAAVIRAAKNQTGVRTQQVSTTDIFRGRWILMPTRNGNSHKSSKHLQTQSIIALRSS